MAFLRRAGSVILALSVLLWMLSNYPAPPIGATGAPIEYSLAGMIGRTLLPIFEPLGFNWQICIALVPGIAAREVVVSALGTVYALSGDGPQAARQLMPLIAHEWSVATGLSLMAWFVFAPQCLSTLVIVRRETASWRWPLVMLSYLLGLAWLASFITYRTAIALGAG